MIRANFLAQTFSLSSHLILEFRSLQKQEISKLNLKFVYAYDF